MQTHDTAHPTPALHFGPAALIQAGSFLCGLAMLALLGVTGAGLAGMATAGIAFAITAAVLFTLTRLEQR